MPKPNRARVWFAGLIAGLVIDSIQYLLDSFVFPDNWAAVAKSIGWPPAAVPQSAPSPAPVLILLQLAGIGAGLLAVRFYANSHREKPSAKTSAVFAWMLAYGPVCAGLILVCAHPKDPANPPMPLIQGIGFALSALVGCLAGGSLGGWVYRESEAAAERTAAREKVAKESAAKQKDIGATA